MKKKCNHHHYCGTIFENYFYLRIFYSNRLFLSECIYRQRKPSQKRNSLLKLKHLFRSYFLCSWWKKKISLIFSKRLKWSVQLIFFLLVWTLNMCNCVWAVKMRFTWSTIGCRCKHHKITLLLLIYASHFHGVKILVSFSHIRSYMVWSCQHYN